MGPGARAVDHMPFPKDGRMSVGVARQCRGVLGKQADRQVAVSVHAVPDAASGWVSEAPDTHPCRVMRLTA
jgi:SRSO17 transposase